MPRKPLFNNLFFIFRKNIMPGKPLFDNFTQHKSFQSEISKLYLELENAFKGKMYGMKSS